MSDVTPSRLSADRNLLFGSLALQMEAIRVSGLVHGTNQVTVAVGLSSIESAAAISDPYPFG
jgi:hypothetical protein